MKKAVKTVSISLAIIALAVISVVVWRIIVILNVCFECERLGQLWVGRVDNYSILSEELQNFISEEEFNDTTDEGRLKLYRKLEGKRFVEKENFPGSTGGIKTKPFDTVSVDGKSYTVEFVLDFDFNPWKLKPEPKVVNYTTYLYEF